MTIEVGSRLPDATLRESIEFGAACPIAPNPVSVAEASRGKRIVIFGLPGAYTSTCSAQHVPSYLESYDALKQKGVELTDEPTERPYGIDFGLRDPFGNHVRIAQMGG